MRYCYILVSIFVLRFLKIRDQYEGEPDLCLIRTTCRPFSCTTTAETIIYVKTVFLAYGPSRICHSFFGGGIKDQDKNKTPDHPQAAFSFFFGRTKTHSECLWQLPGCILNNSFNLNIRY